MRVALGSYSTVLQGLQRHCKACPTHREGDPSIWMWTPPPPTNCWLEAPLGGWGGLCVLGPAEPAPPGPNDSGGKRSYRTQYKTLTIGHKGSDCHSWVNITVIKHMNLSPNPMGSLVTQDGVVAEIIVRTSCI